MNGKRWIMTQDRHPVPVEPKDARGIAAFIRDVVRRVRLGWRLFWDRRVPFWTKLIPPATLAYILLPIDLFPDAAFGLGQLDDVAVLVLGLQLFIELSPPEIVREHLLALGARIQEWRVVKEDSGAEVGGEIEVVEEPQEAAPTPASAEQQEKASQEG